MRGFMKFLAWTFGALAVICLVLYFTLLDVWTVPEDDPQMGVSMVPTLAPGDLVVTMRHGGTSRGNLLKCADPQAPGRFVVAREEGVAGEKIEVNGESPSIDGTRTPSPSACEVPDLTLKDVRTGEDVELHCSLEELGSVKYEAVRAKTRQEPPTKWTVEKDRIYLISDNRHMHVDSRDYGTLDPTTCKHIVFRLWSKGGWSDDKHRFNFLL